jgi:DNA-binding transcriptional LysR family regulator
MGAAMQLSDRIGRRMKLQDLHVLMTVMQAGSMGKAAQNLNITQPAVSRSIAELENALGVRLLERHRRGIEATEYGRALLDCGVAVFDDLRQGVKNIEFLADPTTGEVRIGNTLPSTASSFIAGIIDRLSWRHPRMVFHVVPGEPNTIRRELNERRVDLVITRGSSGFKDDEQFSFETLYDDPFVVLAGVKNPWARRRRTSLPSW